MVGGDTIINGSLKCHRCAVCLGYGCPGNMPGLGGVFSNKNFQLNCVGWNDYFEQLTQQGSAEAITEIEVHPDMLRCAPVTGAVENIGYAEEHDFYYPYLSTAEKLRFGICVGDGCPDTKLQYGLEAVKKLNTPKAAFILKPYPQQKLFERIEWVRNNAEYIGVDIDSYNITTMRNLVHLEQKTAEQLQDFRQHAQRPLIVKGVFTQEDIALVTKLKPDVVYISNHGGRVETRIGSTAEFLASYCKTLKNVCGEIWVDGGIRCKQDIQTALYLGADKVLVGRPLIRAVFDGEEDALAASLFLSSPQAVPLLQQYQ